MKRKLALTRLNRMLERLRSINGICATPQYDQPFSKIRRAWVFGSVAKGSEEPNDIDVFVEFVTPEIRHQDRYQLRNWQVYYDDLGRFVKLFDYNKFGREVVNKNYLIDREFYKDCGCVRTMCAQGYFINFLKFRLPKINIHVVSEDLVFKKN